MLGDLAPNVIGEVELDERPRHVTLAEAGQPRLLLNAAVRALPLFLNDVDRRLDGQAPLAGLQLFDGDLHEHTTYTRVIEAPNGARGGSRTPKGFYTHRILSPERLPVSPLSRDRREFARQEHTEHRSGPQGSARFVETTRESDSVVAPALN